MSQLRILEKFGIFNQSNVLISKGNFSLYNCYQNCTFHFQKVNKQEEDLPPVQEKFLPDEKGPTDDNGCVLQWGNVKNMDDQMKINTEGKGNHLGTRL